MTRISKLSDIKFKRRNIILLSVLAVFIYACSQPIQNKYRTWSVYKADQSSSSYSPLNQINKNNVGQLKVVWAFTPSDAIASTGRGGGGGECNPIVVDGIMYVMGARNRLYSIDAATGKEKWVFDPFNGSSTIPGVGSVKRGVTYWESTDKKDKRILFTAGTNLFAVNAETGKIITSFGKDGKVNMNENMRDDPAKLTVIPTTPGIIFGDLIIQGTEVLEFYDAVPGYVRAYNVRTGELAWVFHTVPLPGEFGYETWPKQTYRFAGGANNWAGMAVDEKRGMVFFSTGSAAHDYDGTNRLGNNLFANSVVALDAKTGKYKWHFQTIHHDLWDYDLSAPPSLVTVTKDGKKIDAVAQTSKVGFVYLFNRDTGEPLFPIEERPVPKSDIPGEVASPTQPFPLKPAAYARQHLTVDSLNPDLPADLRDSVIKKFMSFRYDGLFTPPSIKGTLMMPGSRGGIEWGGAAVDPKGMIYIRANDNPEIETMRKIEPSKEESTFNRGKTIFASYCVACHGADRKGDEQLGYPSLVDVKNRLTKDQIIAKVKTGGGKMPGFAQVINGEEEAIAAFLMDIRTATTPVRARGVTPNMHPDVDTLPRWVNTTAYSSFTVPLPNQAVAAPGVRNRGAQAVKGPWATLNAIDLNTGDYKWRIPFDTGSSGPTVTAGGIVFVSGTTFRAYDKDTGALLWDSKISGTANASVYMVGKKQYVSIAISGTPDAPGANFVTFALPDKK